MKNLRLSIGITAYNESANIKRLLKSILSQVESGYEILEVIVISDGSTDQTVSKIRELSSNKIILKSFPERLGKSARTDQILKFFKGDLLILMDADIVITDKNLLSKVIKTSNSQNDGIIGINAGPSPSVNFFQKVIEIGTLITRDLAERWNDGNNYLSFRGCFLALDKKLAKSISLNSEIVNNDAYLYLSAVTKGYKPRYLSNAYVYYMSPMNFSDHLKQSSRHQDSKSEMKKYFDIDLRQIYSVPVFIFVRVVFKYFFLHPFLFLMYCSVNAISGFKKETKLKSTWRIATSTKKINL